MSEGDRIECVECARSGGCGGKLGKHKTRSNFRGIVIHLSKLANDPEYLKLTGALDWSYRTNLALTGSPLTVEDIENIRRAR